MLVWANWSFWKKGLPPLITELLARGGRLAGKDNADDDDNVHLGPTLSWTKTFSEIKHDRDLILWQVGRATPHHIWVPCNFSHISRQVDSLIMLLGLFYKPAFPNISTCRLASRAEGGRGCGGNKNNSGEALANFASTHRTAPEFLARISELVQEIRGGLSWD